MEKWSIQLLHNLKVKDSNNEVKEMKVLDVCTEGQELYNKHFVEDKYKAGGEPPIALYEMIILAGNPCPEGKFYMVEYLVGDYGVYHHLLVQAVKPEYDIPLILGKLAQVGMIEADYNPYKAWLCDDIEAVRIGTCYEDEEEGPAFDSVHKAAKESEEGVLDYELKNPGTGACFDVYSECGLTEVWLDGNFDCKPVFVCGGENVIDPAFKDMRNKDMKELKEHINEAVRIAADYRLNYIITAGFPSEEGKITVQGGVRCTADFSVYITRSVGRPSYVETLISGLINVCNLFCEDKKEEAMQGLDIVLKSAGIKVDKESATDNE